MTQSVPVLVHVVDPLASPVHGFAVHYWQQGAPLTLCTLLRAYAEYKAASGKTSRMQRVVETDDPTSCQPCTKAIEMVARQQLRHLSAAGTEKVLDLIASMRNGDLMGAADGS
jgi:hypothetical protein